MERVWPIAERVLRHVFHRLLKHAEKVHHV